MNLRVFLLATLCGSVAMAEDVRFASPPQAAKQGGATVVRFAASAATDVEVAVLDAAGAVVRHLAAGAIGGPKTAAPLKAGLSQGLAWDGADDAGRPAAGGPFRFRVRLASAPKLRAYLGRDDQTLGAIAGLAVGPTGEVFLLSTQGFGQSEVRVLGRDGKYLRTILPYAADTPASRAEPIGSLTLDGRRVPMVFSGHSGATVPLTSGMKKQNMVVHPTGALLAASAVGTIAEHGPPRYLLAFHPDGGAPDGMAWVGPQIMGPRGFLGGAGEAGSPFFEHLATSPDGQWVYFTSGGYNGGKQRDNSVHRMKWTDKTIGKPWLGDAAAGADDGHFADPEGLAVDAAGNLYVCDRGNDRLMVFSADGKLLAKAAVETPEQVAVHPKTGAIYLVSRKPDKRNQSTVLRKFSALAGGEPKQVAQWAQNGIELIAVDPSSAEPRLWAATYVAWGRSYALVPVADRGESLEPGADVSTAGGLGELAYLAADAANNRVLVREGFYSRSPVRVFDLAAGAQSSVRLHGTDMATDRAGNLYVMDGYGTNSLSRYDAAGKPLPFSAAGSNTIKVGTYRGYGPDIGIRGLCVSPAGDVYLIRSNNYQYGGVDGHGVESVVDCFGPDGTLKRGAIVAGLGRGDCGLGVDAAGNIYVGMNVKPAEGYPLPAEFEGHIPATDWIWWRKVQRDPPWYYCYYNPYLYHLGSVVKFGPGGGQVYGYGGPPNAAKGQPAPPGPALASVANAPEVAAAFRSGYLARAIRIVGLQWTYPGVGIIPASDVNWGDPACVCRNSHLAADPYGRVYAPSLFRFCIEMLDAAGNRIARIGRYGNADAPAGEIAFVWPQFVGVGEDWLAATDPANRRVALIDLAWAAEATAAAE